MQVLEIQKIEVGLKSMCVCAIQLPRVIERGVGVNDSREFELLIGCHWHIGGGGMLIG